MSPQAGTFVQDLHHLMMARLSERLRPCNQAFDARDTTRIRNIDLESSALDGDKDHQYRVATIVSLDNSTLLEKPKNAPHQCSFR